MLTPGKLYKANTEISFSDINSTIKDGDILLLIKYEKSSMHALESQVKMMFCLFKNKIIKRTVVNSHVEWFDAV